MSGVDLVKTENEDRSELFDDFRSSGLPPLTCVGECLLFALKDTFFSEKLLSEGRLMLLLSGLLLFKVKLTPLLSDMKEL